MKHCLCLAAPCVVPTVQQGRVIVSNTSHPNMTQASGEPLMVLHGEHLSLECEPRYEPTLNNTPITCNNGTWTHMPKCVPGEHSTVDPNSQPTVYILEFS